MTGQFHKLSHLFNNSPRFERPFRFSFTFIYLILTENYADVIPLKLIVTVANPTWVLDSRQRNDHIIHIREYYCTPQWSEYIVHQMFENVKIHNENQM
jgi:hypothetical protein